MSRSCQRLTLSSGERPCSTHRGAPEGLSTRRISRKAGAEDLETLRFCKRQLHGVDTPEREDTPSTRMALAAVIRRQRPRFVFTSDGSGVHPDHKAVTDIVTHAVFYARLPKWNEVPGGDALADSEPHEIERLFYGHCRMERAWREFDFAVDVTHTYQRKTAAIDLYRSVFCGPQAARLERFRIEDQYVGSLVGVEYAEAFKARSPLLVAEPTVFLKTPFG